MSGMLCPVHPSGWEASQLRVGVGVGVGEEDVETVGEQL
jgi:hypothetical protein